MNRIVFAILFEVLGFVTLPITGQFFPVPTPCESAILMVTDECLDIYTAGNDTDAICSGECRGYLELIVAVCDPANAAPSAGIIAKFCRNYNGEECAPTIASISDTCLDMLIAADTNVCSGICASQLDAAVADCERSDDQTARSTVNTYDRVCGVCTAATQALNEDTDCQDALSNDDAGTFCTGTCRTLIDAFINACPNSADEPTDKLNQECGVGNSTMPCDPGTCNHTMPCGSGSQCSHGSGSVKAEAFGVITLLLVVICVFTNLNSLNT